MSKANPEADKLIEKYILSASDNAQPLLIQLRKIISSHPEITEDWKWNSPNFSCEGMVCWIAGFKKHVGINFFKGSLMEDNHGYFENDNDSEKGNRIIRYGFEDKVDAEKLNHYIKQAIQLNQNNIKVPTKKKTVETPQFIVDILSNHPKAKEVFDAFPPSHKKEYIEWLLEAKREATKDKRITTMLEWLEEGKSRNWKYKNC